MSESMLFRLNYYWDSCLPIVSHFLGIGEETGNEAGNWPFIGEFKGFEETGREGGARIEDGRWKMENEEMESVRA